MPELTHLDEAGHARMVDVGAKAVTRREARAAGKIRMSPSALHAVVSGGVPKGDVLAAARIAGIMAAKKTGELIPLCHPLGLDAVQVNFQIDSDGISVTADAAVSGKTGVEMEAMTAACVALLTIYDMVKSMDRAMVIDAVRLLSKVGGKSGAWHAE